MMMTCSSTGMCQWQQANLQRTHLSSKNKVNASHGPGLATKLNMLAAMRSTWTWTTACQCITVTAMPVDTATIIIMTITRHKA